MEQINSTGMVETPAVRPWSENALKARAARRPHGWQTTPRNLVERARERDPQAVSSLCRKYWQAVRSYLQQRGAPQTQAEDATQGCFERILKREDLHKLQLDPEDSFGAWLASRARYQLLNQWKREKKHKPLARFEQLAQVAGGQHNKTSDRLLDEARALELLERAFARLRPTYERLSLELLFDHLKTTLLDNEVDGDLTDAKLCQSLGYCRSYVANARHCLRWVELPAAVLKLQEEDRSRNANRLGSRASITSPREELRALIDALAA